MNADSLRSEQPLVIIAMPVRNAEATIDVAVRSVLAQTYRNWRLVVLDDGSDDQTGQVMRFYTDERIRYISDGRRLGLAARLNEIIDSSEGDYLARLDADDVAYPERLEKQVEFMMRHPDVDLVGSAALLFRDDGAVEGVLDVEQDHEHLASRRWKGFRIPHPSWLGRLGWFRCYRYDPSMQRAQDQELLMRAVDASRFSCIPEILIGYRKNSVFLRKRLLGRAYLARILVVHASKMHRYGRMLRVIAEQLAKGAFDILMAVPVLGKCFAHPAGRPVTPQERIRWSQIVRDLHVHGRKS